VNTSGSLAGKTVTAISAGAYHSCAVADGKAYCWGYNPYGQLGNDTTSNSTVPVQVDTSLLLAGKTVTAITAGTEHTCAVADGMAYCWGDNYVGQLGADTTGSSVPVAVDTSGTLAGKSVTAISAGAYHSCAVADGKAYCWGYNPYGQLGNDTTSNSTVPVRVDTSGPLAARTVTAITTGFWHSCVVAEGRISCWGDNRAGQLGNNTTTNSSVPVPADTSGPLAAQTATAVSAGSYHTCAVAGGRVSCWGDNNFGQLGNSTTSHATVPVAVDTSGPLAGKSVATVEAGYGHTAALIAAVPAPPTGLTGQASDAQATVSWTPPADDGGSPIQQYTATAIPGGATCSSGSTTCLVTGLTNGTAYTFTVTATNAVGTSAPSVPSPPVIPTAPATPPLPVQPIKPAKVTGAKAVVAKGKVTITWKAVAGATSYVLRISKPGGKKYKAWRTTTKRVFKAEVRKGKKYRVQIIAVGPGGRGPVTTIGFKGK
jgi:hypothetical protein